jgi:hypothetical protein
MTNTKARARQLTESIVANATAKPEKTNAIIARVSAVLRALNVKEAKITIEGKQAWIVELQTVIAWSNSLTRIFTAAGVDPEKLAELQSARDSVDQLELDLITELEDIFAQQHQDNMRRYDELNERFNIN